MSDAELFFKYKTEHAFEGKLKGLMNDMMRDFKNKLSTTMNIHSETFRQEFNKVEKQ